MKLFIKKKTDEEYVESIRKFMKRAKWFGLFSILGAVALLALIFYAGHLFDSMRDRLQKSSSQDFYWGLLFGIMSGGPFAIAALNIYSAIQYFRGYRTERLMLKYYDELKSSGKEI